MTPLINVTAVLLSFTTLFGILFHDMHLDRAASVALGLPVLATTLAGTAAADQLLKKGHAHTHVHTVETPKRHSVRVTPNMQPPRDDHRRDVAKKAQTHFGADNGIIWPSV